MKASIRITIALLLGATAIVSAQAHPAAPASQPGAATAQQASAAPSTVAPNNVMQAALVVIQMIDEGKVADVWKGASQVTRATISEKQFIDGVEAKRKALGTPMARDWSMISKSVVAAGGDAPAGAYVTARFQTRFSTNRIGEELVSLHLDDDNNWRFAGYAID